VAPSSNPPFLFWRSRLLNVVRSNKDNRVLIGERCNLLKRLPRPISLIRKGAQGTSDPPLPPAAAIRPAKLRPRNQAVERLGQGVQARPHA